MMHITEKNKLILGAGCLLCILGILAVGIYFFPAKGKNTENKKGLPQIKETFSEGITNLQNGKYKNLVYHEFQASIEDAEGLYHLEFQTNRDDRQHTFLENFENMNKIIDDFFQEDFDKSWIKALFGQGENEVCVDYKDVPVVCQDEKYTTEDNDFLFGNNTAEGGYMVQIAENLTYAWFSRNELQSIGPHHMSAIRSFPYVTCIRQIEDAELPLKDGKVMLSDMENKVLSYLNDSFLLPTTEGITYGIGQALLVEAENGQQGITFQTRRIYKGVPFEYESPSETGLYVDFVGADTGEITYVSSVQPDTIIGFGGTNGSVVETKEVTEIISLDEALGILSNGIGENSVYDVYGVELTYRRTVLEEDLPQGIDDILSPVWKVITINQNDDKYTMFYINAEDGSITQRFEYYYD